MMGTGGNLVLELFHINKLVALIEGCEFDKCEIPHSHIASVLDKGDVFFSVRCSIHDQFITPMQFQALHKHCTFLSSYGS